MEQVRNEQSIYSAAVYCRLSKDDEQAGESVSIEIQKMMLTDFCHERGFSIYEIYADDGYSGLNFNSERKLIMRLNTISLVLGNDESIKYGKDSCRILMRECSAVCDHCVGKLKKFNFFDCSRINFICKEGELKNNIFECMGILEMDIHFEMQYFQYDDREKEKYIYHLVRQSLHYLCEIKGWDFAPIAEALCDFEKNGYVSSFYADIKCKRADYAVKLFCVQTLSQIEIFADLFNKRKFIERKSVLVTYPNVWDYSRYIENLIWVNDYTVLLFTNNNVECYEIEFDTLK